MTSRSNPLKLKITFVQRVASWCLNRFEELTFHCQAGGQAIPLDLYLNPIRNSLSAHNQKEIMRRNKKKKGQNECLLLAHILSEQELPISYLIHLNKLIIILCCYE